jgi:hypothetical protein
MCRSSKCDSCLGLVKTSRSGAGKPCSVAVTNIRCSPTLGCFWAGRDGHVKTTFLLGSPHYVLVKAQRADVQVKAQRVNMQLLWVAAALTCPSQPAQKQPGPLHTPLSLGTLGLPCQPLSHAAFRQSLACVVILYHYPTVSNGCEAASKHPPLQSRHHRLHKCCCRKQV